MEKLCEAWKLRKLEKICFALILEGRVWKCVGGNRTCVWLESHGIRRACHSKERSTWMPLGGFRLSRPRRLMCRWLGGWYCFPLPGVRPYCLVAFADTRTTLRNCTFVVAPDCVRCQFLVKTYMNPLVWPEIWRRKYSVTEHLGDG
jgi:hypothetical protein